MALTGAAALFTIHSRFVVQEFVLKVIKSKRFGEWYVSQHLLGIQRCSDWEVHARSDIPSKYSDRVKKDSKFHLHHHLVTWTFTGTLPSSIRGKLKLA